MEPWPWKKWHHAHMVKRHNQNMVTAQKSKAESWMRAHLRTTGLRWGRQAQSGFRLFDFWNHQLGVDVEVDGREHDPVADENRDWFQFIYRGIVVLRVRNFNEDDAMDALAAIKEAGSWNERRATLGLKPIQDAELPPPIIVPDIVPCLLTTEAVPSGNTNQMQMF